MAEKKVQDLMVSFAEFGSVNEDAPLSEALEVIESSRVRLTSGEPTRAVLVVNHLGEIIGQLGIIEALTALEPKYSVMGDLDIMSRAGLSSEFLDKINQDFNLFDDSLENLLRRSAHVPVGKVMRPLRESIPEEAGLAEAIHKMLMWKAMRVLVTREGKAVGILRLVDVFREIVRIMRSITSQLKS